MCHMSTGVLIGSRASGRHNHNGSFLGYDGKTTTKIIKAHTFLWHFHHSPVIFHTYVSLGKIFHFHMISICSVILSWVCHSFLTVLQASSRRCLYIPGKLSVSFTCLYPNYCGELRSKFIGMQGPENWNINKSFIKYGKAVSTFKHALFILIWRFKKCILFYSFKYLPVFLNILIYLVYLYTLIYFLFLWNKMY